MPPEGHTITLEEGVDAVFRGREDGTLADDTAGFLLALIFTTAINRALSSEEA